MSANTTDLADQMARVLSVLAKRPKPEDGHEHTPEAQAPIPVTFSRLAAPCWFLSALLVATAAILSIQHWTSAVVLPTGVISWLTFGATISFVSAVAIHIGAGQWRIRHDQVEIIIGQGELAAQLQALMLRLDARPGAEDAAGVAEMSERFRDLEADLASVRLWQKQIHEELTARLKGKLTDLRQPGQQQT